MKKNIKNIPRRALAGLFLVLSIPVWMTATAQVNNPAYADYLLVGRFGEVCTMCEAVVLCEANVTELPVRETVPRHGSFALYHFQVRTFWSQISTIWEWFITNFTTEGIESRGHTRPVHVYEVVDDQWMPMRVTEARLVLNPGLIELGGTNIDRINHRWIDADTGEEIGYCQRLPLWKTLEMIESRSPDEDNKDA